MIDRLKAQHEEEMRVLIDTAEEESNGQRERITELENALKQSQNNASDSPTELPNVS